MVGPKKRTFWLLFQSIYSLVSLRLISQVEFIYVAQYAWKGIAIDTV